MVTTSSTGSGGNSQPPLPDPTATSHPINPPPIYFVEILGGDEPRYPMVTFRRGDARKMANRFNGLVNTDGARAVVHRCEIPPLVETVATSTSDQSQLPPVDQLTGLAELLSQFDATEAPGANPLSAIAHALGKEGAVLAQGLREMAQAIEAFAADQK